MTDILYLACNRLEFTQASMAALLANTNWSLVSRLVIYDDGSTDGTRDYLWSLRDLPAPTIMRATTLRSPVAVMRDYLGTAAPLFVKLDSDVIVPPGWLDLCCDVMREFPELDLLGIEPPDSRMPHGRKPMTREPTRNLEMQRGLPRWIPCKTIGGIGAMRRKAFEGRARLEACEIYGGFQDWQRCNPEVTRGWVAPALDLFLLDRLPFDPWAALSLDYIAKGWQRPWRLYGESASHLWKWWMNAN